MTVRNPSGAPGPPSKALVICAYVRRDRVKAPDRDFLQPLAGVHIGSCIDPAAYDVELFHEQWEGPFDARAIVPGQFDIVFVSGLQQDFDRMRQLSYSFRRAGAKVIAGGNICTLFPEFASQFFDAVCVGGVETVFDVMRDHAAGQLRRIYRETSGPRGAFPLAYELFAKAGMNLPVHLIEASRGCSFKCSFCILPAEGAAHVAYGVAALDGMIYRAIATSPKWSLRRRFPMLWFMDNNFSDDAAYLHEVCALLASRPRVRAWGALITQNVLRDRALIGEMARAKCRALFVGIESFDPAFLRAMRKTQNLSRTQSVEADVMFAESLGIAIVYSQLVDPRTANIERTRNELLAVARDGRLPLPSFISFVSPLAGTELFWSCMDRGELRPGLLLREMDGETIAFSRTVEPIEDLVEFGRLAFSATHKLVPRRLVLWNVIKRMIRARRIDPASWIMALATTWRIMHKSRSYEVSARRTYLGGAERLDPQYEEFPADIEAADRARYFDPVRLVELDGSAAAWLEPYRRRPGARRDQPAPARPREPVG